MSNIYHTEPPTHGKVILHTSFGDVDIELWPKEAPLACRNFIQLALEGYYDHTLVNRIVKDFMIQMGDPFSDGAGGESIWGRPFKDEIHGRIKFNHRGQVAMANENKPNTNHSQFFITLGPCEWLDRKHTIFGKVTGNTFYNLSRLGDADVSGDGDRPVENFYINSIEVLLNPFDDIVPRDIKRAPIPSATSTSTKKEQREGKRDLKLLSFGDDEEEENRSKPEKRVRMISAHEDKMKPSARLVPQVAEELKDLQRPVLGDNDASEFNRRMMEKLKQKQTSVINNSKQSNDQTRDESGIAVSASAAETSDASAEKASRVAKQRLEDPEDGWGDERDTKVDNKVDEYKRLKRETAKARQAVNVLTGAEAEKVSKQLGDDKLITPLELRRQRFISRKKEFGSREAETLQRLSAFSSKIKQAKSSSGNLESESMYSKTYSGQVLEGSSDSEAEIKDKRGEENKEKDDLWFAGKLKFRKHIDDAYRNSGSDGRSLVDYEVFDPRGQFAGPASSSSKTSSSNRY